MFGRKKKPEKVVAAARELASATEDERTISRLLSGDIGRVRGMTGGDPARAAAIADLARTLLERVGSPQNVCMVGQTVMPGHGEKRMVDRLIDGEEQAVRDELARGEFDPRALLRDGELVFTGW